jgi:LAO/AO transport system kinase
MNETCPEERPMADDRDDLVGGVLDGKVGAIARMMTLIERGSPEVNGYLTELYKAPHHAHVIGVTGPAGSGKSTLTARIARSYRDRGAEVGIIAVDPSSVFSGGAILGDRIRMGTLSGDCGIFIRSMATRGAMGGLARAALDAVTVLEAAGKDVVLLETVGVGQAEVDVVGVAQTIAVVSVPGLGDSVQALKAGLLEIADVHVVNKADREGAQRTASELKEMLRLAHRKPGQWNVPVTMTTAASGDGVAELTKEFERHHDWMAANGELQRRRRENAAARVRWAAEDLVRRLLAESHAAFEQAVERVLVRTSDPITEASRLVERFSEGNNHV